MAAKWQRPINYDRIDREKVPLLVLFSYFFTRQSLPINNVKMIKFTFFWRTRRHDSFLPMNFKLEWNLSNKKQIMRNGKILK